MRYTCPKCAEVFETERGDSGEELLCPACGHSFLDSEATVVDETGPGSLGASLAGSELAGFLIDERIGSGAMGEVYRATQLSLDRTVALKVLPRAFARKPAFVQRFYTESMALSGLNHPHIVSIIDRGHVGDTYFFVMEHVDGPSLESIMGRPVSAELFVSIAKQVTAGLEYAHARDIVHRDIKPSNIMVNSQQEVKIADFGLAGVIHEQRALAATRTRRARMGTPAYMSPEQRVDPLAVDGRSDIFSFGIVAHELLTAERPELPMQRPPSEIAETADPRLDDILARCLADDPADRYQTAAELLADLEEIERELQDAPPCPQCGTLNPVRFERCVNCGRSLEEFFDICPQCGRRNRTDVRRCLYCGTDLEKGRTLVTTQVTLLLDEADHERLQGNFDEALELLAEVRQIKGRAFESERERAAGLEERIEEERRRAAERRYAEGRRLMKEQRFPEAIRMFEGVPRDVRNTRKAIAMAEELQRRLLDQRKQLATTNIVLLAMALLLILLVLVKLVI